MRKFDGLKVKSIRISKGLSLDELASKVGIETSSLRGIENLEILNIQYETMKKIATVMNVSVSDFFTENAHAKKQINVPSVNPKIYKKFIDTVRKYQYLTGLKNEEVSIKMGMSYGYLHNVEHKYRKGRLSSKSHTGLINCTRVLEQEIKNITSDNNQTHTKLSYKTIDADSEVLFSFNGLKTTVNDLSDKELQVIISIFDTLKIPADISRIEIRETSIFRGGNNG